jgi:hypothetical protein
MVPPAANSWQPFIDLKASAILGMTSIVLAILGMIFAPLPVLGIIITGFGMIAGIVAMVAGRVRQYALAIRWGGGGLALGCLTMALNVAIVYTPAGYVPSRPPPAIWQELPGRDVIPAPAGVDTVENQHPRKTQGQKGE